MEIVMLDDGFGARLERRAAVAEDRFSFDRYTQDGRGGYPSPALVCYHCGAPALFIYRRSHRGPLSTGQDHNAPAVALESWAEKPYCTILCAQRAIRCGKLYLPDVEPPFA